ncbi:unnamed protein product [Arabidopsis thaliana]|uniref:HMG box domain-containing protein n=1 Tax=Arabidopsis thaliana TaxID=3702 RepID=A0A5S9Y6L4_ARATH|nr:unnamed protein product [Arabidopsis thaliana]
MSGASSEDSSIFARCEDVDCNKKIPVELVRMHICYAMFHRTLARGFGTQTQAKKKPTKKKKSTTSLTDFAVFMNHFRKSFRTDYNGALVKEGSKIGWEMWKSMTEDEKKDYLDKAADEEDEDEDTVEEQADDSDDAEDNEVKETDDDN